MHHLLTPGRPTRAASITLVLAAVAFVVGGADHARLYHRGYAEVDVVGPLFLLNAAGTLAVVLLLPARRVRLFVAGVLAVSLGSIASILVSHDGSFLGFREGGWDGDATLILAAEVICVGLVLLAGALGALRADGAPEAAGAPGPAAVAGAAVAAIVLVLPMVGIATGDAPAGDPAPAGAALAASRRAVAAGGPAVQRGREEFEEEHCDACHAIAATGADGVLGPRMDTQDDPLEEIVGNITDPRTDVRRGYEGELMPVDYASRMDAGEIRDVAMFVRAASAGAERGPRGGEEGAAEGR